MTYQYSIPAVVGPSYSTSPQNEQPFDEQELTSVNLLASWAADRTRRQEREEAERRFYDILAADAELRDKEQL